MAILEGKKIFDPRNKKQVISGNPALIIGDLVQTYFIKDISEEDFWKNIANMATWCEEKNFVLGIYGKMEEDE
ncbi:MAG: hypothetical protein E3J52_11090 [Promethearchaeota archaeon]|nr:MAG: hypothetical protein E3J52_11090 [Candidatus Lokiarchaeota archaeon]